MPPDFFDNALSYPMAPAGGLFVAIVGLAICLGAVLGRWRMNLLFSGLALAAIVMTLFVGRLSAHLPPPSALAIGALAVALLLEFALFPIVIARLRPKGARAIMLGTLALVGAHFLLMAPAFGPLIVVLGLACLLNASLAMMLVTIPDAYAWGSDGLLKLGIGALMLHMSPAFG